MALHVEHYNSLVATAGAVGGNKAGVARVKSFPPPSVMTAVAKAVGFSETAFVVLTSEPNVVAVRFFTPEGEVDLCGHATIAVFSAMPRNASYVMLTTTQGSLRVVVDANGRVRMEQSTPTFRPLTAPADVDAILAALNLPRAHLGDVPITIVSTGLPDIFVHVASSHVLHDGMRPDMAAIAALSTRHDTIGMHVFTLSPDEVDVTAECRNFAPRFGIDEEAATGTSSGALGALLLHHGRATSPLTFSQGRRMGLPSRIGCIITTEAASITGVEISGIADPCGGQDVDVDASSV